MAHAELSDEADMIGQQLDELQPGTTLLHGQYTISSFLNNGGFGITYLAKDSLDRDVVIKECFVDAFCRRTRTIVSARSRAHQGEMKSIIRHFIQEARSLSKLRHPNIVGVHQVFEDNDTAYMAIDFVNGRDLADIIDDPEAHLTPGQIVMIARKLLSAVGYVHEHGLLHRDISPDNILLNAEGEPVLIDFGAAREHAAEGGRKHSALRVVKDGYSPQEFYIAGSEQGPWSDLYALAASLYHVIKGEAPVNGQARLAAIADQRPDPYVPLAGTIEGYPAGFLEAIDQAMNTKPSRRLQSASEWLQMLDGLRGPAHDKAVVFTPLNDLDDAAVAVPAGSGRGKLFGALALAVMAAAGAGGYVMLGNDGAAGVGSGPKVVLDASAKTTAPAPKPVEAVAATPAEATPVKAAADPVVVPAKKPAAPAVVPAKAPDAAASSVPAPEAPKPETPKPEAAKAEAAVPAAAPPAALVAAPEALPGKDLPVAAAEPPAPAAPPPAAPEAPAVVAEVAPPVVMPAPPLGPLVQQQVSLALWDIAIPFDYVETTEGETGLALISAVHSDVDLSVVGSWIAEGIEIHAVNEMPISDDQSFSSQILNAMKLDPDGYTRVSVRYKTAAMANFDHGLLAVPMVRKLGLADGTLLEARRNDGVWKLVVTETVASGDGLRPGDVLVSELETGTEIRGADELEAAMNNLVSKNIGKARFEVTRDGVPTVVNFALARHD